MGTLVQTADVIYQALGTLRFQLEQLAERGRIVMSRDSSNKEDPESRAAISAALAGLDQARETMAWMGHDRWGLSGAQGLDGPRHPVCWQRSYLPRLRHLHRAFLRAGFTRIQGPWNAPY